MNPRMSNPEILRLWGFLRSSGMVATKLNHENTKVRRHEMKKTKTQHQQLIGVLFVSSFVFFVFSYFRVFVLVFNPLVD
jgi:hypothetical protein